MELTHGEQMSYSIPGVRILIKPKLLHCTMYIVQCSQVNRVKLETLTYSGRMTAIRLLF